MSWSPAYVVLCVLLILPKCLGSKFVLAASYYVVWMPSLQHPRGCLGMQYLAVASNGNALKKLSTQPICHIDTDEVYTNLEQSNAKEAMDVKSNKNSPKQLTPVTIMVVGTISSVKSRILLKVLLDSGSTSTMINRKCLPRNCQTCKILKAGRWKHW